MLCGGRHDFMFLDRADAGRQLADTLLTKHITADLVIGLTRGGVAVSAEIAKKLKTSHTALAVTKVSSPEDPEFAVGAVVQGDQQTDVQNKTIMLADDGAATGWTMYEAVRWVRRHNARKIIVVLPVAPAEALDKLRGVADDVIVLTIPEDFRSVGEYYRNFPQLTDQDVVELTRNRVIPIERSE